METDVTTTQGLLTVEFGEEYGSYLLWNYTCFPFDEKQSFAQANELVEAQETNRLDEYIRMCDNREAEMVEEYQLNIGVEA